MGVVDYERLKWLGLEAELAYILRHYQVDTLDEAMDVVEEELIWLRHIALEVEQEE
nr:hypothetical protein [uncultured Bacteroides sp.]